MSCTLLYGGLAIVLVPIPIALTKAVIDYGFPKNMSTNALVAGLFNGQWFLGAFTGPTIAGALVESVGFETGATIMGSISILVFCIICVTAIVFRLDACTARQQYRSQILVESAAAASLLSARSSQHNASHIFPAMPVHERKMLYGAMELTKSHGANA